MFYGGELFLISTCIILAIVVPFLTIFSFVRAITLKREISKLSKEVKNLREKIEDLYFGIDQNEEKIDTQKVEENIKIIDDVKEKIYNVQEEIQPNKKTSKPKKSETFQKTYTHKNTYEEAPRKSNTSMKNIITWIFGGNLVAKIAILILFFGISFLLKYSIDKGYLSPEIRMLGSAILGFVLVGLGFKLKQKNELFALILQGGGIGVLYLTTFAAAKLYPMLSIPFAFVILAALCAISVVFALSQNAISLAIIAFCGAYLAPILLSDGSGNHKVLFIFYTLVSISILAISKWRSWRSLNLLGFAFTYIVFYYWMFSAYEPTFYIETQIFVIANLIIYGFLAVIFFIRGERNIFTDVLMLFGTPLLSFLVQHEMVKHLEFGAAFCAVCFGLLYVVGTYIALKSYKEKAVQVLYYGLGIAISFATIAIPLAFNNHLTSLIWMVEGSAISYIALRNRKDRMSYVGLGITIFGILYAFGDDAIYRFSNFDFITLLGAMSAITLFNACIFYHFQSINKNLKSISFIILFFAALFWIVWIVGGAQRALENDMLSILMFFTVAVWIWYFIGKKQNFVTLKYAIISLWPVLAFAVWIDFFDKSSLIWELGWLAAFFSSYFYLYIEQNSVEISEKIKPILHITLFWIVCGFIHNKCQYLLNANLHWGYDAVKYSILLGIFAFVVLLVYYMRKKSIFPFNNFKKEYWMIGLLPVIFYIIIRLLVGSTYSGDVFGLKFVSFINPLEQSAIFALLVVVFYFCVIYKSSKNDQNVKKANPLVYIIPSILVFIWANSILVRFLSHLFNIPWTGYYLWHDSIIQASLSIFWTLIAFGLLAFAKKKSTRAVWFVGACLLGVVVCKLVFIDSAKLEGLVRAFVFIGVALLMLLIGYLAPIPPKNRNYELEKEKQ